MQQPVFGAREWAPRVELFDAGVRVTLPAIGLRQSWGYWVVCLAFLCVPQAGLFLLERLPAIPPNSRFVGSAICWTLQALGSYGVLQPMLAFFLCDAVATATPSELTIERPGRVFVAGQRQAWPRENLRAVIADGCGLWIVPRDGLPTGLFFERPRAHVDLLAKLLCAGLEMSEEWPCGPGAIPVWFVLDDPAEPFDPQSALAGELRLKDNRLRLSHACHRVFDMSMQAATAAPGAPKWSWPLVSGGDRSMCRELSEWTELAMVDGATIRTWRTVCQAEEPARLTIWSTAPDALQSMVQAFWDPANADPDRERAA